MPRPRSYAPALRHLRAADPVLAGVIDAVGPCRLVVRQEGTHFEHVARAIVYQQLSGKAAGTIHGRVLALYGDRPPTPAELLATPDEALRGAGLSRQKLGYLRDLAARAEAGVIPFDALDALDDQAIIDALVTVKGVGRWTAQMFLIFRLGRLDVLPELDLGVQNGMRKAYRARKPLGPADVIRRGARWAPYRSVGSWYMWRVADGEGAM